MPAIALSHNPKKKKHWAELRLDLCFDTGALRRPAPSLSRPLGRGSLFASEIDRFERFWHGANDGTLLVGGFRVLPIEKHLAKLC